LSVFRWSENVPTTFSEWIEPLMAKLYFYYSSMNAGKSTLLLQSSYNYRERGMQTLILQPEVDDRFGVGKVASRIGLSAQARTFHVNENLLSVVQTIHQQDALHCVLVDEAQFLTGRQVKQLSDVCDLLDIPVLAYGLRTDFQGQLFEGSQQLLAWADSLVEVKTICHCGRKATMVLRIGSDGQAVRDGDQVQIGGNDRYVSVCRQHFKQGMSEANRGQLSLLPEG
jgi:thymidine kinase